MEAFLRYLIFRYGEQVIGWTIQQVVDRLASDGQLNLDECPTSVCRAVQAVQKKGYDLDPDCGVYFWELPYKEQ